MMTMKVQVGAQQLSPVLEREVLYMVYPLNDKRVISSYNRFKKALLTLQETVLDPDKSNKYLQDAAIKRFEYTYETAWKAVKFILEAKGVFLRYPSELFSEAFSAGWILNAEIFRDMILSRNATSHLYNEYKAEEVFIKVCEQFFPELRYLQLQLEVVVNGHEST